MKKNDIFALEITSLSNDGNGVGRADGMAVFVPFSAVGDKLTVRAEKVQERYAFARITEISTPSADRVQADCPQFTRCGGCALRHISYEAELVAKQQMAQDAISRLGGFEMQTQPILASPVQNHYRNKVQFPVAQDENGLKPGFYAARSHRVVDTAGCCLLQDPVLGEIASESCRILSGFGVTAYDEKSGKGTLRHILLRKSDLNGGILLCLVINAKKLPCAEAAAQQIMEKYPAVQTVVLNRNFTRGNEILSPDCVTVAGSGFIADEICGVPVEVTALSFLQINHAAAEQLYRAVEKLAGLKSGETLIDLYCGAGTIGLAVTDSSHTLYGIETIADAVRSAEKNAALMGRENAHFLCDDAGAVQKLLQSGVHPDVIITDPPRKGCSQDVLDAIVASGASRCVMVSCNVATLARDLKYLCENGYTLKTVQPADLFPRTRHVEAAALLVKEG